MRGPAWYRPLTEPDRDPSREDHSHEPEPSRRREDLKTPASEANRPVTPLRPPAPAPHPVGELLRQLDPERAMREAQVQALNDMVRAGRIGWREWTWRVKDLQEPPEAAKADELAEARAAAAQARADRERAEVARQQSNDGRER